MDKDYLLLKRASASRPSGQWNDDDFDVLANGVVVGRIFNATASPVGASWMWTLAFGHHENRTPTAMRPERLRWLRLPRVGVGNERPITDVAPPSSDLPPVALLKQCGGGVVPRREDSRKPRSSRAVQHLRWGQGRD
jgi:hypothetical protein